MMSRTIHVLAFATCLALLAMPSSVQARIEAEASIGEPFGVGHVTVSGPDVAIDINKVQIEERNGRVFYPAVGQGVVGRLLGQILGDPADRPTSGVTIYFL